MNPEDLKDERFEELCALAAIGELSASEFAELSEHLPGCDNCRALYADFRRISSSDIGAVAAGRRYGDDTVGDLDEPALLKSLLERAHAETSLRGRRLDFRESLERRPTRWLSRWWTWLQGPIPSSVAVVVLCAAAGIVGYQYRDRQLPTAIVPSAQQSNAREIEAGETAPERQVATEKLQRSQAELAALQKSLSEARRKYAELSNQQTTLEMELAGTKEQLQHSRWVTSKVWCVRFSMPQRCCSRFSQRFASSWVLEREVTNQV